MLSRWNKAVSDHRQSRWLAAAGPSKGPDRRRTKTEPTRRSLLLLGELGELRIPGTVKLWESPGTAGGLPMALTARKFFQTADGIFLALPHASTTLFQAQHQALDEIIRRWLSTDVPRLSHPDTTHPRDLLESGDHPLHRHTKTRPRHVSAGCRMDAGCRARRGSPRPDPHLWRP